MNYRILGNSGVSVSVISLGTWKFREGETNKKEWSELFQDAYNRGVNHFDSAITYDAGHAEGFLSGLWNSIPRNKIVLGTKCYFPTSDKSEDRGLSRVHIQKCVHTSLKNLGTDYIDLFQCHRWDEQTPIEETIQTMDELVTQGKIRHWGLGSATAAQVVEATLKADLMGCARPVSHQHVYNMFNRTAEFEALSTGHRMGLGFLAYSPLAQGVLTGKYSTDSKPSGSRAVNPQDIRGMWDLEPVKIEKAKQLKTVAEKSGISASTLALSWCLRSDDVTSVITSVSNPKQLNENLNAASADITGLLDEIEQILNNKPYNIYTKI